MRHDRRGLVGGTPGLDQRPRDRLEVADPHVEHERAGERGKRRPVERTFGFVRGLVPGDERDRRRVVPVGDRDSRVGGGGHARRHARHDLERNAGLGQCLGLLAAAPEHERVAALEADHRPSRPSKLDQRAADLILPDRRLTGTLADVAEVRVGPRIIERTGRDQAVVQDHVGLGDQIERTARDQAGVAGPGADQVDDPRLAMSPL